jgi:hypothetical protein
MKPFLHSKRLLKIFSMLLLLIACKKEEQIVEPPLPVNELLTTISLRLISSDNLDTLTAIWRDLTPNDTNPPDTSLAILNVKDSTLYRAELYLLDETKSPAEDIRAEVQERANYHRIFYFPSTSLGPNFNVNITDFDTNSPPLALGLITNIQTVQSSNGVLRVVLKHQPNGKDGSFEPGTIDADVNFRIFITP